MRAFAIIGVAACCGALPAQADTTQCFQIVQPVAGTGLLSPVKLNTCSGESWMLVRMPLEKGFYTYRWQPLQHADQEPRLFDQGISLSPR